MCEAMRQGPKTIGPLQDVVEPFFEQADSLPVTLLVYDVLLALEREGVLHRKTDRYPGARENLDAPKISFWLED
jgi:hypothetical protein